MKNKIINLVLIVAAISGAVADGQLANVSASTSPKAINGIFHGDSTNGLGCDVYIDYGNYIGYGKTVDNYHEYPTSDVYIYNQTTNNFHGYYRLPWEALFKISLFDSTGKPVKRTMAGKKFAAWWTKEQIHDWIHDEIAKHGDGFLSFSLWSNNSIGHGYFSIPQLFDLKQPGEYALHIKMRLLKDGNGPAGSANYFITCLPEVVAKVQIRPEDVAPTNSVPNNQTNSAAR